MTEPWSTFGANPTERIVSLEEGRKGLERDLNGVQERLARIEADVAAIRRWMDSSGGKVQGALAIVSLLGLGGLLHYLSSLFFQKN